MSVFISEIETAKLHIQLRWPTHILNINAGINRYTSEVYEAVQSEFVSLYHEFLKGTCARLKSKDHAWLTSECSPRYDNLV